MFQMADTLRVFPSELSSSRTLVVARRAHLPSSTFPAVRCRAGCPVVLSAVVASPRDCVVRKSVPRSPTGEGLQQGPGSPGRSSSSSWRSRRWFRTLSRASIHPWPWPSAEQAHEQPDLRCLSTSAVASRAVTRTNHLGVLEPASPTVLAQRQERVGSASHRVSSQRLHAFPIVQPPCQHLSS